jgi:hypothetical protein
MRILLYIVATLVAYGAYTLGAPQPLGELRGADCVSGLDYDQQYRESARERALELVREMQRNRQLIYGFGNRFAGNWYGLQWNIVNVANYFLGTTIAEPEFTAAHATHAGGAIKELSLKFYVLSALPLDKCVVQRLIPQTDADGLTAARKKLDLLAAMLERGQGQ